MRGGRYTPLRRLTWSPMVCRRKVRSNPITNPHPQRHTGPQLPKMAPVQWPLSEVLAGVLLLLLSPLVLPLLAIHGALWYRDPGANGAQRLFALKFDDQDILMRPSQLPRAMLAAVTCFLRCSPDVFVLGAAKSGTSSLVAALATHDAIQTSHLAKETHYFQGRSFLRSPGADGFLGRQLNMPRLGAMVDGILFRSFFPTRVARWWRSQSRSQRQHVLTVEATPTLRFPELARRLAANQTGTTEPPKAVILLRDPIDRAWSHYRMLKGHFPDCERRTFEEAVREELADIREGRSALGEACMRAQSLRPAIGRGPEVALDYLDKRYLSSSDYATLIPHFIESFKRENVAVISFEDLADDTLATTNRVCAFLGIALLATLNAGPANVGKAFLKGKTARESLEPETLRSVEAFFKPTVAFVQKEFGISF